MEKQIKNALKSAKADYVEIRVQEGVSTGITYVGKELESIGENSTFGGCVRALVKGGWGFVAFNDIENLPRYVDMACEQARFVGTKESQLAPVSAISDHVKTKVDVDPADISLTDKQAICNKYNNMILSSKQIQTSNVRYVDSHGTLYFASTNGSFIIQETIFCGISLLAMGRDGMNVQQAYHSVGDLRGFNNVQNQEQKCEEVTKRAVDLLTAKPVTGGKYTVIIDPKLCGVFVHEAFGHLSEADFMYENPTGNARAISYAHAPIVRMTNTYMESRNYTFEKMLSEVDDGIYAIGALGGQTNMEMFTFSAEDAYMIRNGKIQEKVRDVVLTGNVFETLMNIDAIGNDLKIHGGLGGCGKGGQSPLRVSDGGPHVRIRNVVIGGR